MAVDIVRVKSDIKKGLLRVMIIGESILLCDVKSGEAVKIGELPKKNKWIPVECGTMCSNCKKVFDHHFEINHYACIKLKFCPECKARMDGDT